MGLFSKNTDTNATNATTAAQSGATGGTGYGGNNTNVNDVNQPVRQSGTTGDNLNTTSGGAGYPSNTATNPNQQGGYVDEGMGMGSGHHNNAVHGGMAQGNNVPAQGQNIGANNTEGLGDSAIGTTGMGNMGNQGGQQGGVPLVNPMAPQSNATAADHMLGTAGPAGAAVAAEQHHHHHHQGQNQNTGAYDSGMGNNNAGGYGNNQNVGTNTAGGQHNLRHDAEGAAVGGAAGHEYNKHHQGGGPGAGTGAAAGAFGGHEYNKHHDGNRTDQTNATGADHHLGTAGAAAGTAGVAEHEHHKHHHHHDQNQNTTGNTGYGDNSNTGYGNNNQNVGTTNTAGGQHNLRHDAEGAAVGGVAGHEYDKHHTGNHGPGAGTGAAAGALGGHEYNKHHDRTGAGPQTNATSTGRGPAVASHQGSGNEEKEAKSLQRSGKIDKIIGSIIGSTSMKEQGLQKQAEGAALRQEARGNDPNDTTTGNTMGTNNNDVSRTGIQPSHGPGTSAAVGGGVGGGGPRPM